MEPTSAAVCAAGARDAEAVAREAAAAAREGRLQGALRRT